MIGGIWLSAGYYFTGTEGVLHTIRDMSRLLHPAMLDDLALAATALSE